MIAVPEQVATLACAAIGVPSPSVVWSFNGSPVSTTARVVIQPPLTSGGSSTLTVLGVMEVDEGEYRCVANNSEGTAMSDSASLQLAGESWR